VGGGHVGALMFSALGDPLPPLIRQERTVHGAAAPVAYVPARPVQEICGGLAQGCRAGGRRPEETRPWRLSAGTVPNAAGSAYIEQGETKLLAAVFGPRQAGERGVRERTAEGTLAVEFNFAPFSSRFCGREDNDKRALLYGSTLRRTLESLILLDRYAKTAFDVYLQVLEDDGAVLTAALAAASLALADAAVEMRDLAAGATVHLAPGPAGQASLLLDCDGEEERALPAGSAVVHLGLCPARGSVCLLHSSGPLPMDKLEQMVALARSTAKALGGEMRKCLESRVDHHKAAKRARLSTEEQLQEPHYGVLDDGYGI